MTNTTIQPYAIEPRRSIDLTLSENPLGCSPVVLETLQNSQTAPNRYPTANGNRLRQQLANFFQAQPENFFVANGSEAIILNIPRIFAKPGDEVLIPQLSFPLFRQYCLAAGLIENLIPMQKNLGIDLAGFQKQLKPTPQLIFLCNPNNPTGMVLSRAEIINFLDKVPSSTMVVVDEANIDFGGESVFDQALQRQNVLVLRTFSKGFGLAGFRVGFAVGSPRLIQKLISNTQPFPISSLSEELAIAALTAPSFIDDTKQFMDQERARLKTRLTKLGCTVFDSQANNIFVKLPSSIKPETFFEQLNQADISVVKGSKFVGFDDSFFRISPRGLGVNQTFLKKLGLILKGIYE